MTNKDLSSLPLEVITLVGRENLDKLNPFGQRAVVASLLQMYEGEGMARMKENKEQLINSILILNRM
jgi:hypothetical protein